MDKTLAEKLVKVCGLIPTMPKAKQGYGYKYTDLDEIFKTIKPILKDNGLGFMQKVDYKQIGESYVSGIETIIFDTEGACESSFVPLPETTVKGANNAQNMGASITYMKRYAICAMLGISSDEDTDGVVEPRQDKTTAPKKQQVTPPVRHKPVGGANAVEFLKNLILEYVVEMGEYFAIAEATASTGVESECKAMADRCLDYLRRKNITVEMIK